MIRRAKSSQLVILAFCFFLSCPFSWGFELFTHEDITGAAFDRSALSDALRDVGIDSERRLNGGLLRGSRLPVDWLVKGARDEDDTISTNFARYRNHFYDPVNNRGLTATAFGVIPIRGERAPDWALEDQDEFFTQAFSYRDARLAFLTALIAGAPLDREAALASTFEILGHVIHSLQDMASPPHTRNDIHGGFGFGPTSLFERYLDQAQVRRRLNFDGTPVRFGLPRQYWSTADGRGLAEFVNRNFVSEGTNFTTRAEGAIGGGYPNPVLRLGADDQGRPFETALDIQTQLEPGLRDRSGNLIDGSVTIFANNFQDPITGLALRNERMTTLSLFDRELERKGAPLVFTLNRYNIEAQAVSLIPRAVGYSAGLLDYFFRGRLDVDVIEDHANSSLFQLAGTNASPDTLVDGTLTLYADNPQGQRSQVTTFGAVPVSGVASGQPLTPIPPSFEPPMDAERFVAVYTGKLGEETPSGTFPGGVIAKVVGGVRVEEVFSDGINWKLRTPKGVFLLKKEGDLPLTAAEFEGVRWGDGDNLLVARTPFGMDQPNRFVVYEIQRQAGSAEVVTVSTPDGPAVPLTVRNEAVFPGGGIDLGTTVTFVSSIQYSQRIAEYVHKAVGTTDPQGNCAIDHRELGPISVRTVASGGPTFSGSFQVRLDLAREGTFGTLSEPTIWFLQEVAATADARLLGLVVVFLTSPEGSPVSVPFIGLNRDTGAEEIVGQQTFSPSFPPGVNILVWALVDLQAGTVVASTATSNISLASQTGGEGFPDVYQHFVNTCTGFEQWASVSPVPVSSDFPIDQLTNVSVGGGILAHTVLGWVKDELNTLTLNGQRLFDFQLGTVFGSGRSLIECVGLLAGGVTCNGIEQSGSQGVLVKMADNLQDARRSRPAPGSERLALIASTGFGARDTVLAWDPGKGARVLLALPSLGENVHVLGPVTGTATLVAPLDGWRGSFHIVSLEGSEAPAFFSNDNFNFFTLLNPRFLYNSDDLKFYRRRPPLQASVLPLKLADLPDGSNPIGDYHAIRLP